MKGTSKLRHLRIAPRKVRLVADLIRGRNVQEADALLRFTTRRAAEPVRKALKAAVASAEQPQERLYVKQITVDQGPMLKRFRARAHGRAADIQKKTSHVSIILAEGKPRSALVAAAPTVQKKEGSKKETQSDKKKIQRAPQHDEQRTGSVKGVAPKVFRRKVI